MPLSEAGRATALQLSRDDLGLPLSETVTAGAREQRNRDQSMAWRLGFDLLQRRLRQQDDYLPTPSLPSAWLKKGFADYCRDLAASSNCPPRASRTGPHWSGPAGNASPKCATSNWCAACSAARWNSGYCSTAPCCWRNRATAYTSAPSAPAS